MEGLFLPVDLVMLQFAVPAVAYVAVRTDHPGGHGLSQTERRLDDDLVIAGHGVLGEHDP